MTPKAKKKAYRQISKLEDFFYVQMSLGDMKTDEYDWVREKIMDLISSVSNLDDENMQECRDRMNTMGLSMEMEE